MNLNLTPGAEGLRTRLFHIIFESDTPGAKAFDIALIVAILLSVAVIMLGSIETYAERYGELFFYLEWVFTLLFSIELILRIYCLEKPTLYLRSFYGIVDLIAVLPPWLVLLVPGAHGLVIVRLLRVLRIFRILRLMEFVGEARLLMDALKRSMRQILLFFSAILMVITLFAALMYTIESSEAGFTSIPMSMYWAIVSMTTVGYGDIVPATALGKSITVVLMLLGYSIIAVPTGVFSAQVIRSIREERYSEEACPGCGHERHEKRARYCLRCGTWLDEDSEDPRKKDDDKTDDAQENRHESDEDKN
ncbi:MULTISPECIES: ion transporter [Halomonadaceae]|jgi:voltage-gated potassium channel|uniref:ion transporter n=1 Tax=Halomonadaceae TaxID=28256 RepID=UPI0012EFB028|nr:MULTISPECIES: ion transporter [Halomonas]MCD1586990.1 ion transporter [Halomonas sp. IOP_14]CAD5268629.1 putative Potassium voltage-gated channel subfamily KQT; potassium channel, VIC family [Halomonas sp. I3]CAD5274550.1 Voltage-dependent potassium channel [Halomonas sp. 113]CAD5276173.1 Voltage-dependent potassium channel [Halomonas sp. 59]CAD5277433.1 Voltage-dependent potassium channel [Halomonas sp. 156]